MQNSDAYTKELELLHSRKSFGTASGVPGILQSFLDDRPDVASILDFGCGKGNTFSESANKQGYDKFTVTIQLQIQLNFPNKLTLFTVAMC